MAAVVLCAAPAAADSGWPRTYPTATGGHVTLYQPQVASWDGQRHLVTYVAVAHTARTGEAPVLGTVKVESDTAVAVAERLVRLTTFAVTEAHFGQVSRDRTRAIVADLERAVPAPERVIALDRLLAGLDTSQLRPKNVDGVKAEPPAIHVRTSPAILVGFDGTPIWSGIAGSDLRYAVNTNWDVFQAADGTLYLRRDATWLKASSLAGPWAPAGTLPRSFSSLPADANWRDVRASLPGAPLAAAQVPAVVVSTVPAELVVLEGEPSYVLTQPDGLLLWVNNTDSDVFRMGLTGPVYFLVAGRWFSAPDFDGPWTFATPTLPGEFRRIAADHPRARVLASVPGTPQAAEAVLLAGIPQTARIDKRGLTAPAVVYQGEPQFVVIERTSVRRAVNTGFDVLEVGGRYYLCYQGVWFVAAAPSGPWAVTGQVPPAVYTIPASSPAHHVTYVTVVDDSPDVVVVASAAGYTGVTIAWGCAVWGTGWYYAPYVWSGGAYPVYYPYAATYGAAAWYNPWNGSYQRGAVAYGPYGGVGATARYNPTTGTYARGAVAWGPYGATGAAQAYNPRTGTYAQTRQDAGVYGNWGSSYVQRGDDWARTGHVTNDVTGVTRAGVRADDGAAIGRSGPAGSGFVAAGEEGVYAGRDGNVYRRADGGGWQKYEDGSWGTTQHPVEDGAAKARERAGAAGVDGSTLGQLDRDRAARAEGAQRMRGEGARSAGSRPSGPPARPSGGRRPRG